LAFDVSLKLTSFEIDGLDLSLAGEQAGLIIVMWRFRSVTLTEVVNGE
jgi:hypothetical protein